MQFIFNKNTECGVMPIFRFYITTVIIFIKYHNKYSLVLLENTIMDRNIYRTQLQIKRTLAYVSRAHNVDFEPSFSGAFTNIIEQDWYY